MKLSPAVNFNSILGTALMHGDPKSAKNTVKSSVSFHAFGIFTLKSCLFNVGEIVTRSDEN